MKVTQVSKAGRGHDFDLSRDSWFESLPGYFFLSFFQFARWLPKLAINLNIYGGKIITVLHVQYRAIKI